MKKLIGTLAAALTLLAARPAKADLVSAVDPLVDNSLENRAAVFAANTGLGAALGCIGAEISGDGCLEGLWKGSLGGAVTFAGMELGSYNARVPFTGLAGRQIVNLGSSMTSNAMFSRGLLQRYETDFGPVIFSFDSEEGFRPYIMPLSTGVTVYHLISGHTLDLVQSIEDGTFVFRLDWESRSEILGGGGATISNIPIHVTDYNIGRSHENIHTYQLSRMRWADELVPELGPIRYGAEALNGSMSLGACIYHGDLYDYSPLELEAYSMQR